MDDGRLGNMDPTINTGGWHEFQPGKNHRQQQESHSSSLLPREGNNAGSSRSGGTIALVSARRGGELLSLSDEYVTPPTMPPHLRPSTTMTTPIGLQRGSVFKMPPPRHTVVAATTPRKSEEESLTSSLAFESSIASPSTFSSRLVPLTILSRNGMVTRSVASLSPSAVVASPSPLIITSSTTSSMMNLLPKITLTPKGGLTETVDSVINRFNHDARIDNLPEFHSDDEQSQSSTGGVKTHTFFNREESDNTEIVALHLCSPPNVHDDDDSPMRPMPSITLHHLDIIERPILLSPHSKSSPSFLRPIQSHKLQIRCRSLFDSTTKNDPIEYILHADAIAEAAKSNESLTDDDVSECNEYHPDFHLGMPTATAAITTAAITTTQERMKIPLQPRRVACDRHKSSLNNTPPLSVGLSMSKSVEQDSDEPRFDHNETLPSSVYCRPLSTTSLCGLNILQTTTTPPPSITTYDSSEYYPSIRQPSNRPSSYNSLNSLGFSIDGA